MKRRVEESEEESVKKAKTEIESQSLDNGFSYLDESYNTSLETERKPLSHELYEPLSTHLGQHFNRLERKDLSAFMSTCKFFHQNKDLRERKFQLKPSIFAYSPFNKLAINSKNEMLLSGVKIKEFFGISNESNEPVITNILAEALSKGENIKDMVVNSYFFLILTNHNRMLLSNRCLVGGLNKASPGFSEKGLDKVATSYLGFKSLAEIPLDFLSRDETIDTIAVDSNIHLVTSKNRFFCLARNSSGGFCPTQIINLPLLGEGEYVKKISLNLTKTIFLTSKSRILTLSCMGEKPYYAESSSFLEENELIEDISFGFMHTLILTSKSRLFYYADHSDKTLDDHFDPIHFTEIDSASFLKENERVITITAGSYSSMVLTSNHRILIRGANHETFTETMEDERLEGEFFEEIAAGEQLVMARTTFNRVLGAGLVDWTHQDPMTHEIKPFTDFIREKLQPSSSVEMKM